jgi:hypothetical protein
MPKALVVVVALVLAWLMPAPAAAWGFAAHRFIMSRALERLPPDIKPFFEKFRPEIVVRVVDPDVWRTAGWEDDPNHFLDFGVREYGSYPFAALPREYGAALEKFGIATLRRNGMVPWRLAEEFGNLRRAFESFTRQSSYATGEAALFAAVASHYVQDAHQPFHASDNYDGQLTGNQGIHARFERDLFERFESRLTIDVQAIPPLENPRDFAFDVLLSGYQLVEPILKADSEAVAGKETYDDEYFEKLFARVRPILEKRIADSIAATVAVVVGAWEAAGRPALALTDARPVQKVRK